MVLTPQITMALGAGGSVAEQKNHMIIPGTRMTLVLVGKGHVLGGLPSKIEVMCVLGMHISPLNNCHLAISLLLSC